jgi:calcineurin-like phosphoesterase family protein
MEGALAYASDFPWDWVLLLGDWVDNRSLNPHIRDKLRLREGLRFQKDQELAGKLFRDLLQAVRRKKLARVSVCKGNHEAWIDQYIDRHPELEGTLRPDEVFTGADEVLPYRQWALAKRIGKLHFLHGYGRGGISQVRSWLTAFNVNLVGGHLHRMEQVSKPSAHGTVSAWCLGYLGSKDLGDDYVMAPTAWQHGFGVVYMDDRSGEFQLFPVVITKKGFFSPEGRYYKL